MKKPYIELNYSTLTYKSGNLNEHYHNGYEIILITQGQSEFTINGSKSIFEKYSLVFINNLEKHKMRTIKLPYSRYMAILDASFLDNMIMDPILLSIFKVRPKSFEHGFNIKINDITIIEDYFYKLSIIYNNKDVFWQIEFNALFSNFLVFIYRNYKEHFPISSIDKNKDLILRVQSFIDDHYKQDLSLDLIASEFYIDKYYLSHLYKDITGFSIKQYILLKKIAYAKNELYYTDKSITQIAIETGFNSQSNFTRIFQKKEEVSPLQYRVKYRSK